MRRLKILREEANYSQQDLAKMLRTTQQTIGRWETGKAEPSLSALRDLAMIFGTSVDDLLGTNPLSKKAPSTGLHYFRSGESTRDGFWGHVGLLIPGHHQTNWYPITVGTANQITRSLASEEGDWFCASTLNNKMLAVNPLKLKRIWLLDDACDAPDDWSREAAEDYSGEPLEFYRGLDSFFLNRDEFIANASDTFRKIIESFVAEHALDEERADKFLHDTVLHQIDGTSISYWAEAQNLYDLVFNIELGSAPKLLNVPAFGGNFESYYPAENICAIEMPLIDIMGAAADLDEEIRREGEPASEKEEPKPSDRKKTGVRTSKKPQRKIRK